MSKGSTLSQKEIRSRAYAEAAALLASDCDAADLQCESEISEEDASKVREYIRNEIVDHLNERGSR